MTKVLLTGTPGTGKSTVLTHIAEQGVTCYDLDDTPGAVALQVRETGELAEWPAGYVDWDYYVWNLQEQKLRELLDSSENVFVAVSASNQARFYEWFDYVFALTVDDETLRYHLEHRNAHESGQTPKNIDRIVSRNQSKIDSFTADDTIIIDNTQPVPVVANKILELCNVSQRLDS